MLLWLDGEHAVAVGDAYRLKFHQAIIAHGGHQFVCRRYLKGFLLLASAFILSAQPTTIFDTAQSWIVGDGLWRSTYMLGYREGFAMASQFVMPEPNEPADVALTALDLLPKLVNCLKPMNVGQMMDITTGYLATHPEKKNNLRRAVVIEALTTACRERGWK